MDEARVGPWSRRQFIALLLILLLGTTTRLVGLQDQSLWYDESDRVIIASLPLSEMFHQIAQESVLHLPFYFLAVKPFTQPFQETAVRFPSVVFGVLGIAFMAQAGRKLFGRSGGLMAALLFALNPFHIWFSRDANFYAVVALSSIGTLYFFACLLQRPTWRSWIGLTLLTGLGLWTHYFALAIPVAGLTYLVIRFRRYHHLLRPWVASQLAAVLPLIPWYVFLVQRGQFYFGSSASESPKLVDLFYTFWNFSIGYTVEYTPIVIASLMLFGGTVLLGVWQIRRRNELLLPLLYCCLPIALTFGMSFRLPMYVDRYVIVSLPAFLLLAVAGVMKAPRNWRAILLAGLVLASTLGALRFYYDEEYYTKEDWRGLVRYIQSQERPGDAIMPLRIHSLLPFIAAYYHGDLPFEPILLQDRVRQPSTIASQYGRLWYVYGHRHDSTHLLAKCQQVDVYSVVQQKEVRDWLKEHESDLVQREDFACVSVLLYDLAGGAEPGH